MDVKEIINKVIEQINQLREANSLIPLHLINSEEPSFKYLYFHETEIEINVGDDVDLNDYILKEVENIINCKEDDNHSLPLKDSLLDRSATNVDIFYDQSVSTLKIRYYYHFIELDQVGPVIGGHLVIEGTMVDSKYTPALCVLEFSESPSDDFSEIGLVLPWKFMVIPTDDGPTKIMVPIAVEQQHSSGFIRISIYVSDSNNVPLDEDSPLADGYDTNGIRALSIQAIQLITKAIQDGDDYHLDMNGESTDQVEDGVNAEPTGKGKEEVAEASSNKEKDFIESFFVEDPGMEYHSAITDIKIALDYDEVSALQGEGFELICDQMTEHGIIHEQEHRWKFHIMASYQSVTEAESFIEDMAWIKCLKSLGTVPTVPMFQLLHDTDISQPDDDYSIYLAVKSGPTPRFNRLSMISSAIEFEQQFNNHLVQCGAVYRPAPTSVVRIMGGPCGVLLHAIDGNDREVVQQRNKIEKGETFSIMSGADGGKSGSALLGPHAIVSSTKRNTLTGEDRNGTGFDLENSTFRSSMDAEENSDDEDDDEYENEEEVIAQLSEQLASLDREKSSLTKLNNELQKKAVLLMLRDKSIQSQSAAQRTAVEVSITAVEGHNGVDQAEHSLEREKLYQDILNQIVEERAKLTRQHREFDQLALDLQTRLDDKEFKANGIVSSFKSFKKEILMKAENTRTGHHIPLKQIQQFEALEQKREEDLEKVRLRNISLRTTYRKLERTLRAREQLAEGLHMIDFEQLKIENQTINEKIEERNEELAKLKRKKTTTVQVLTHVREKLRFLENDNGKVQNELSQLEGEITLTRNAVTGVKLDRDGLKSDNKELRAKQGFASNDLLLIDYENRRRKVEQLRASVDELKERYNLLMKQVKKTRRIQQNAAINTLSLFDQSSVMDK